MTNTKWLPKPSTSILLLLFILIAGVVVYFQVTDDQAPEITGDDLHVVSGDSDIALLDTDNDGLKDWEEVLWGTDIENADTDGDGATDGEEIAVRRDPRIAGPDDELADPVIALPSDETATGTQTLTQTQLFSRAFLTTYIDSSLSGRSAADDIGVLTALAIPSLPSPTVHTASDLKILTNIDEESIHSYGNAAGNILKQNAPDVENELLVLLDAVQKVNADNEDLADLLVVSESYKKNANELFDLSVPVGAADVHARLINAFFAVARDLEYMALLFDDPLVAISGFASYFETSSELVIALDELRKYLLAHTEFKPNEHGYLFVSKL